MVEMAVMVVLAVLVVSEREAVGQIIPRIQMQVLAKALVEVGVGEVMEAEVVMVATVEIL